MNFLAHLQLSSQQEAWMVGNFIADFIKNRDRDALPEGIREGIILHRKIDSYTDQHPIVKKGVKRLAKIQGKYAPVVIDILFDHLLAVNWNTYMDISLDGFAANCYQLLGSKTELLPEPLKSRLPLMVADNFLSRYGTLDGIRFAMGKMDQRAKFPSNFSQSVEQLQSEWEIFNEEFAEFYPELIQFAHREVEKF